MLQWITGVINRMGYAGIVLLMFLENVFPPIPSELIMPLAGFTAAQGQMSFVGIAIAGTLGSVLGSLPLYYLGKIVGEERLKAWADRYGQWLTVSGDDIERAKKWMEKHGGKAAFLGRLVPGVRSLISVPAGIGAMPLGEFLIYSTLGAGIWSSALAYLGIRLGAKHELVSRFLGPAVYVVFAGIALSIAVSVVRRKKQKT